jgi:hypothetical protein
MGAGVNKLCPRVMCPLPSIPTYRLAEGCPRALGDIRQAPSEVYPKPGFGVHEVILPQSTG